MFNFDKIADLDSSFKYTKLSIEFNKNKFGTRSKKQIKILKLVFNSSLAWKCRLDMALKNICQTSIFQRRVILGCFFFNYQKSEVQDFL